MIYTQEFMTPLAANQALVIYHLSCFEFLPPTDVELPILKAFKPLSIKIHRIISLTGLRTIEIVCCTYSKRF